MTVCKTINRVNEYLCPYICRVRDIVSKPRICNSGEKPISLENRATSRATGVGKDYNLIYFDPPCMNFKFHWHTLRGGPQIFTNKSRLSALRALLAVTRSGNKHKHIIRSPKLSMGSSVSNTTAFAHLAVIIIPRDVLKVVFGGVTAVSRLVPVPVRQMVN